uniref:MAP7 domain-containing protein n=1 Tax=Anopheles coluzzii TaxID=1518534 RepID=A0A8W7PLF1_ANOCL
LLVMGLIDDDSFNESVHSSAIMLTDESDRIPSTTLAVLRGILVKSLSRENLSLTDQQQLLGTRKARHVQFSLAGNRDATVQKQSRPSSANRDRLHEQSVAHTLHWFACVGDDSVDNGRNTEELQKEREERIKQMKERQNEERQKKLEELKAQALAAQKFREQKEEERRRRMDDLRRRESDRRSQVEERRRAIIEADNERREYILRKNQERDQRMETKRRNDRGSIQFAFGSSTPRMIDTSDSGMCSSFWAHRRATSITNVAYTGAALTRRSSERELTDSASKKRATSASGLDRSTDDDTAEMNYQRTVNRRKTDLMPTIPSPRDSSRSSLGTHTPRTPGRAFSMTRLDQLAQPRRRNGEHISAILERERRQALELENLTRLSLSSSRSSPTGSGGNSKRMSRSMSQLAGSGAKYRNQSQDSNSGRSPGFGGGRKSSFNSSSINSGSTSPMRRNDTSKSMSQLNTAGSTPRITKTERLRQQYHHHQQQQQHHQQHQNQLLVTNGLRSGEMTPTSLNTSRPGSAMSSSTTASGIVYRRTLPAQRKPRPASIAVTGVSASGLKEDKPPLPKTGSGASTGSGVSSATSKHRLSSAGSGSITTTPAKSASGTETPTKKPLTLHSAEKRSAGARGATPKASSTPLQSPGPEKASRNLLDSLKKSADGPKKVPASKTPAQKDDAVVVEAKQEPPSVAAPKVEELSAQQEAILQRDDGSQQASLVEVDQSFGQEEQPQQQQEEVVVPVQQEAPAPAQTEDAELPKQAEEAVTVEVVEQAPTTKQQQQAPLEQQDVSAVQAAEPTVMVAEEVPENVNGSLTVEVSGAGADAMTASMIAKRINTEEEAKAALAERRRLAREEAERLAELERKRIEAEEQAERQRILEEEERLRKLEEETIRLAEEQRRMEEERLQQAIEEARRRDEEERKRREEEARQKAEREEAERKAREEAERQRVEMAERLKKEEKEREERRKRVEAIMSRTRAKGAANNTPTKNNEDDKENAMSKSQIFDKSVTEKENLLLASSTAGAAVVVANNNLNNGSTSNGTVVEPATNEEGTNGTKGESLLLTTNGKSEQQSPAMMASSNGSSNATTANSTSDLIIEDALMGQTNGHKNGTMDNVFAVNDSMKAQTVPTELTNDFYTPKNGDHHQNGDSSGDGTDRDAYPSLIEPNTAGTEQQQHCSSFDSSGTVSTVTTETTIVMADGASTNADQLIDFASFSTSEEPFGHSMPRDASVSDANFNPLLASPAFGGSVAGAGSENETSLAQHTPLDVHNISNNNSINPFFTVSDPVLLDSKRRESGGNDAPEAVLFDLTLDNTGNGGSNNSITSSPFFNNNNNNNNNTAPSSNNTPWLVSATTDGQENRGK